jgi:hypothetical protein
MKISAYTLTLLVGACLLFSGCSRPPAKTKAVAPEKSTALVTPEWLKAEPLVVVGNWDSMPIFRRRVGGGLTSQEEQYRKEMTEEAVKRLKDVGVNLAITHFFKGFGLQAERDHLEDARRYISLLKKYGIRAGVYIGSTIAYETFLVENPEADEWFAPDFMGRPVFYDDQTFRKRVYFMHPGYRDYMKRVLRLAVDDYKVDEIDFDNTSMQAQPPIFHHPMAVQDFRDWLQNRYPPETLIRRFGFANMRYVTPPSYDRPLRTIDDPLFQEWAQFRSDQLASYYAEMAAHIRSMNPNVAIATNPHSGISGRNTVWDQGVDYPTFLPHMDIVWTEEGNEATVTSDGILVSKIRTYKMATSLKKRVITYTGGGRGGKIQMAESMAYNRQSLGMVGGALAGYELPEDQRKYIKFFINNFQYFRDVDNVADVAVLHSHASMAFNNDLPWQSAMLFEQALIQAKVPFDIIFDQQLGDLSRYRVLVMPDQECLTDAQLESISGFVNRGGGLVATELTSLYTEWRRRRPDFGLRDLFRISAPQVDRPEGQEMVASAPVVKNQVGKGRVVYIPAVKPAIPKPPAVPMTSQYWKLPLNANDLIEAVKWAAGGALSLELKAPPTVTAELIFQEKNSSLILHLINYDALRHPVVNNLVARVLIPDGKNVDSVYTLSPDEDKSLHIASKLKGQRLEFTVPRLATYSLVVIKLR